MCLFEVLRDAVCFVFYWFAVMVCVCVCLCVRSQTHVVVALGCDVLCVVVCMPLCFDVGLRVCVNACFVYKGACVRCVRLIA